MCCVCVCVYYERLCVCGWLLSGVCAFAPRPLPVSVRHQTAHDINLNVGEIVISLQASCYWLKPAANRQQIPAPFLTSHHQSTPAPPSTIHLSISPSSFLPLLSHRPVIPCTSGPLALQAHFSSSSSSLHLFFNPSSFTSSLFCSFQYPPPPVSSFLPCLCSFSSASEPRASAP